LREKHLKESEKQKESNKFNHKREKLKREREEGEAL
jgi:hypothetical protein